MIRYYKEWFPNPEADSLNLDIMNRKFELPLEDHVLDCFRSIEETLDNVKMISHRFVIDFNKISITEYEQNRTKGKKPPQNIVYINDSRLGELNMVFEVDLSEEPVLKEQPDKWKRFLAKQKNVKLGGDPTKLYYTVKELVPVADKRDGSYILKSKRYIPQYQLTETTTYNTSNQLVLKSIMGIKLERRKIEVHDRAGDLYTLNTWRCNLMNDMAPMMFFYLSEYGWYDTLEFFSIGTYAELVTEEECDQNYIYFVVNPSLSLALKVSKMALSSQYVQGIIGSLLTVLGAKITMEEIMDQNYWISRIGSTKKGAIKASHFELGRRYRILFRRMLDGGSKKSYRLTMHNKNTVLHSIRWMVQEYANLRARDNLDLSYKRLRGNEYIAQFITGVISEKLRKFIHTTANTPEKLKAKYDNLFKYKGMEVISKLHKSGLVKDEDIVNDMNDVYMRFAATTKGPNALGNINPRNITMRQRGLHYSHLGKIGISECSSSDPGRTANICPLAETDGLFFKDTPPEPEEFAYNFIHEIGGMTEWVAKDGTILLAITDPTKFNNVLDPSDDIEIRIIKGGNSDTGN